MITNLQKKQQQGFTLMTIIFIIVILALVGSYIVSLFGLTRATNTLALQGIRAYYAAQSGIEWGLFKISTPAGGPYVCPAGSAATCPTGYTGTQNILNLAQSGLTGFTVTLTCCQNSVTEGTSTYKVFQLTSKSEYGALGSADYVSRQLYQAASDPSAP